MKIGVIADDFTGATDIALTLAEGGLSTVPGPPALCGAMRDKHGIYMIGDSRLNIVGLNATTVPILAQAIADVGV